MQKVPNCKVVTEPPSEIAEPSIVIDEFAKSFPNQYLNVGVAEQNMTGIATGLGLEGKKVFTYSIANFVTLRCLEQIRNDAAYHEVNLTIVCSGGGFTWYTGVHSLCYRRFVHNEINTKYNNNISIRLS